MDIIGNWLNRVDDDEGLKYFESLYDISPYQMIVDHQIFHITRLFPEKVQHVVFMEYDGDINGIMSLNPGEHLMVYSDGCMAEEGRVFNTDGMAFIELVRDCKKVAMWSVENSPYDMVKDDWEEDMDGEDFTYQDALEAVREELKKHDIDKEVTESNVIFVRQL
jgi:hypothetical protein